MHKWTHIALVLSLPVATLACQRLDDPTPDEYVGVDSADLESAELPAALGSAGAVALGDDQVDAEGSTRFTADATLAADGDVSSLLPADDAGADPATTQRSLREVVVAVRWGYFPPEASDVWVDWSGFVAASRGTVEVIRPLRFEHDPDSVRPHEDFVRRDTDPRLVRFRSETRPAWDGLLLRIRRPTLAPDVVVFHVGGVTRALAFEELYDLDASETVDAAGHELKIRARAVPAEHPCVTPLAQAQGHFDVAGAALSGTIDAAAGPVTMDGHMLDVRGPYGLVGVRLSDAGGADAGSARGIYATFHYAPGGIFATRVRDAADDLRGARAGRFGADGSFAAHVIARCE